MRSACWSGVSRRSWQSGIGSWRRRGVSVNSAVSKWHDGNPNGRVRNSPFALVPKPQRICSRTALVRARKGGIRLRGAPPRLTAPTRVLGVSIPTIRQKVRSLGTASDINPSTHVYAKAAVQHDALPLLQHRTERHCLPSLPSPRFGYEIAH